MKSAYLGYHAFSVLISSFSSTDKLFNDWKSLRNIWRHFKNDRIRLVTCAKDLETDIILWLNKQGCCVTDTLRAVEAIEEFDKWGLYGREETKQWKRYLMYYEQIDLLPQSQDDSSTKYGSGNESDQEIMLVLNNILRPGEKADKYCHFSGGEYDILRDCLKDLHLWYEDEQWNDLKATYYELNWDIFMAVLEARHAKPGVTDNETIRHFSDY